MLVKNFLRGAAAFGASAMSLILVAPGAEARRVVPDTTLAEAWEQVDVYPWPLGPAGLDGCRAVLSRRSRLSGGFRLREGGGTYVQSFGREPGVVGKVNGSIACDRRPIERHAAVTSWGYPIADLN